VTAENPTRSQIVGADAGASLIKLALEDPPGTYTLQRMDGGAFVLAGAQLRALREQGVLRAAITGCGAQKLAEEIGGALLPIDEFQAWGLGARQLLADAGQPLQRFLLVSVGTGTSALLVEPGRTQRVGGSALGGGALLGLAASLLDTRDYSQIMQMAEQGDRKRVDLLVGDLYPEGVAGLPGDLNAASFGKLARGLPSEAADRAHALLGLLGENIGMLCAALATRHDVEHVVFGGGALSKGSHLGDLLRAICQGSGQQAILLRDGAYVGAVGALVHARQHAEALGSR